MPPTENRHKHSRQPDIIKKHTFKPSVLKQLTVAAMSLEELGASELGTQEYWDKQYKTEVSNFRNHKDVGEVWFGEDISDRIIHWMIKNTSKAKKILDIGCGNGMLLVELAINGEFTNLVGMDYSNDAIVLAKEVAAHYKTNIEFVVHNVLTQDLPLCSFDVVLDKGTYDAISLSSNARDNRNIYILNICRCLKLGGLLIITSCNWMKEELSVHFESMFDVHSVIPTPQFKFGGKVGNVVSSVIFKKRVHET